MSRPFATPPPVPIPGIALSTPRRHVLLVTLDRPRQLNAIRTDTHPLLDRLWAWFDGEPSLRVAVVTGRGRAFCAGADLKAWNDSHETANDGSPAATGDAREPKKRDEGGFGGLSNRRGKKPVVAAVNGLCLGGGFEMILNVDLVVAHRSARFGLPEVTKGVVAIAGALPRLAHTVGRPRASEMALLGRMGYTAAQMRDWGIVNFVVDGDRADEAVLDEALRCADEMANNSPDAVIVSREGILGGWEAEDPKSSTDRVDAGVYGRMYAGDNMKEGVLSFVEKRKPVWKDSKL